jgi:hypothetical protein
MIDPENRWKYFAIIAAAFLIFTILLLPGMVKAQGTSVPINYYADTLTNPKVFSAIANPLVSFTIEYNPAIAGDNASAREWTNANVSYSFNWTAPYPASWKSDCAFVVESGQYLPCTSGLVPRSALTTGLLVFSVAPQSSLPPHLINASSGTYPTYLTTDLAWYPPGGYVPPGRSAGLGYSYQTMWGCEVVSGVLTGMPPCGVSITLDPSLPPSTIISETMPENWTTPLLPNGSCASGSDWMRGIGNITSINNSGGRNTSVVGETGTVGAFRSCYGSTFQVPYGTTITTSYPLLFGISLALPPTSISIRATQTTTITANYTLLWLLVIALVLIPIAYLIIRERRKHLYLRYWNDLVEKEGKTALFAGGMIVSADYTSWLLIAVVAGIIYGAYRLRKEWKEYQNMKHFFESKEEEKVRKETGKRLARGVGIGIRRIPEQGKEVAKGEAK